MSEKKIKRPLVTKGGRVVNHGRQPDSALHPEWKLTPRQMEIAEAMVQAKSKKGFPTSVAELARQLDADDKYIRGLLKRETFQAYLNYLLAMDGIVLETAFWKGMQLGLQVGDPKVLSLYATMTGKIQKQEAPKVVVEIRSPDQQLALPRYEDVEDAEVIEDGE